MGPSKREVRCEAPQPAVDATGLEDPDQEDDDQDDQENGPQTDVHGVPPFGRNSFFPSSEPANLPAEPGRGRVRMPSGDHESSPPHPARIRPHRSACRLGGPFGAGAWAPPGPIRRTRGLGRTAYCTAADLLRRLDGAARAALPVHRRPHPRRADTPEMDLVEPMGLPQARACAPRMRLQQMGHVPLGDR